MKRFTVVDNGYDIDEVNRFIDIVISRFEKLNNDNIEYKREIDILNDRLDNSLDSDRLERTILAIEENNRKLEDITSERSREIIDEAKNNASIIIHEALIKSEKIEHEKELLEKNIKIYKEKIKELLESQLMILDDIYKL